MSGGKLVSIEEELKEAIGLLKARYEWMTTGRYTTTVSCQSVCVCVLQALICDSCGLQSTAFWSCEW